MTNDLSSYSHDGSKYRATFIGMLHLEEKYLFASCNNTSLIQSYTIHIQPLSILFYLLFIFKILNHFANHSYLI